LAGKAFFPKPGSEFIHASLRMCVHPLEDIDEIGVRVDEAQKQLPRSILRWPSTERVAEKIERRKG